MCITVYLTLEPLSDLPPAWPRNVRVKANSPNLCPTMFSVIYTGINLIPLWTATVCPTNSGGIVLRLAQVLITFFCPTEFNDSTFLYNFSSINGPFFRDLAINLVPLLAAPFNNHLVRRFMLFTCF